MFCPNCGTKDNEEFRFCKACGANLSAVRQAAAVRETGDRFDWGNTWVAEMFLSEAERIKREKELDRLRGITPEVKRYNEIKAGVITSSVGLGVSIFLYVLFQGIILSGQVPPHDVEIISRIWVAGIIPLLIGLGIIFNGLFLSKKQVEIALRESQRESEIEGAAQRSTLGPANTSEFVSPHFSVTEGTTRHLSSRKAANRES